MAEPEELLVELTHRGAVAARRLWLRHHPGAEAASRSLAGLRAHLELVLAGLADDPMAILPADPPAPRTWVARLLRPTPRHLGESTPAAATDGVRVYLPRTLPDELVSPDLAPADAYRVLLAVQVARARRGAGDLIPPASAGPLRALFELAEAVAADAWLAGVFPGLALRLATARRLCLAHRPADANLRPVERRVEALIRRVLAAPPSEPMAEVPCPASSADSRAWAERVAAALPAAGGSFRGLPAVACWGRILPRGLEPAVPQRPGERDVAEGRGGPGRTLTLRRTPRVREAKAGEDDAPAGTWIIRPDEPHESVEDPFGQNRPADRDDEAAAEELADALADLPETRVVTTPTPPREALVSEIPLPRGPRPGGASGQARGVVYPEWDYRLQSYRLHGAVVRELPVLSGDGHWTDAALRRHAALVRHVRRQFASLRPERIQLRRQQDGPAPDIEAWVEAWADRRAGVAGAAGEDRLYVSERAARRSLAIAVVIDVSASTDAWVADTRRVIDVEREALLVVGEALEQLGDRYAIWGFSGEGPGDVRLHVVKRFGEPGGRAVARRIERLEPDRYTRIGAALRHATAGLAAEPAARRLLLLLTDGRPNDVDRYEGRYGIEDARQAVREAARAGVPVFCLTVDRAAPAYLGALFGPGRSVLLRRPELLPAALVDVLRRLIGRC